MTTTQTRAELIPFTSCRGAILVDPSAPDDVRCWVDLLRVEAVESCGWAWIQAPSAALIAATRRLWSRTCPGWVMEPGTSTPRTDVGIVGHLTHGCVRNQIRDAGVPARVLSAEQATAYLALTPEAAQRRIHACLGYSGTVGEYTVLDLILEEGSALPKQVRRAVDMDDQDRVTYRRFEERGEKVTDCVIRGAL